MKQATLNHVFRLIWNDRLRLFVPVAETQCRGGHRGSSPRRRMMRAALGVLLIPSLSWAGGVEVAPGSGGTRVYQSPNGVTVVDIDRANRQGLSHNKYLNYNVDGNGLVLNNGALQSGAQQQSQLAGKILSNANLDRGARVILNEVVAANRSQLAGFTEVVGAKADVVLANQYGITCNGCGFINTDRVTLSTGQPDIRDGMLRGFNVDRGQIVVHGQGLNATNQEYFDLVARSVKLDGNLHARDLGITTGASEWDYASREATASTSEESVPDLALDSTVLGGMYADRIYIHATEAGVGVRMLGEAAASASDFRLTAAGTIEIGADISAHRDVALATSQTGERALALKDASLSAKRDVTLSAAGEASLSGGTLVADRTLALDVGTLDDQASTATGDFNNQRHGGAGVDVTVAGRTIINGVDWSSDGHQAWTLASLDVGALGATLYGDTLALTATDAGLSLGDARVIAAGDLTLNARGDIDTGDGEAQVVASQTGDVRIDTDATLTNRGRLVASQGDMTVNAVSGIRNDGTLAGADTNIASDGSIDNRGTLGGEGDTTLAGTSGERAAGLDNRGTVQAGRILTVRSEQIHNRDGALMLSTDGALIEGDSLDNQGELVVANRAGASAEMILRRLDNADQAILQSAGGLSLAIGESLENAGELLANGDITVSGAGGYHLTNSGTLQSGASLCITGDGACQGSADRAAGVNLTVNAGGVLKARDMDVRADTVALNGDDDDGGEISSDQGLTLAANTLAINNARARVIGGTGTTDIVLHQGLTNRGALHSHGDLDLSAQTIDNRATAGLSANGDLNLHAVGGDIDNAGAFYAGDTLDLNAQGDIVNRAGATIHAGDGGGAGEIVTQSTNFTNHGEIVALSDITLNVDRAFVNETRFNGQSIGKKLGGVENPYLITNIKIANEGDFDHGMNVWLKEDRITRREHLTGGLTEQQLSDLTKAQILSTGDGGQLTVNYGESGLNKIAVLSASNVLLNTDNAAATFTNESLTLYEYKYTRRWMEFADEKFAADNYLGVWARINPNAPTDSSGHCPNCADIDDDSNHHDNWEPGAGWTKVGPTEKNGESAPSQALVNQARDAATAGAIRDGIKEERSFGAGIFATTLQVEGGDFNNAGSPYQNPDDATSGTALSGAVTATSASATGNIDPGSFAGDTITFPTITLPTNPNGHFVTGQDPQAGYLVETNPLYTSGNLIGSDFLADQLGLDLDQIGLRLGDAGYEAYLIRQQLINETGGNRLAGYADEQGMIQGLYASSGQQAEALGLTWGEPLTEQQITALDQDMVWMVEREVNGQTVLAPQVYLSEATRQAINEGAVVSADNTVMNVENLTNTGGTLAGTDNLIVNSRHDITNVGGDIQGGNVYLTAGGDITNRTIAEGAGDETTYRTVIGRTGSIDSGGELLLSADGDILNRGANLSADGTAVITAGNDIVIDSIENKTTGTSYTESKNTRTTTNKTRTRHLGSNLDMGGDMLLESGNDTTIAASDVNVDGNMAVLTGGSFNLEARQDQDTTHTEKREEGFGVAGGLYGERTTTTDDFIGTNHAANLNVGGDALIDSGEDIKIQGSNLNVGGNAALLAENDIQILDGLDERRTTTKTETMTVFSTDTGSDTDTDSDAAAGTGPASARASASAEAEAENDSALNFYKRTETTTEETRTTSVGSSLNVGGALGMDAGNDVTIRGSDVTGKEIAISGRDVKVLAGENTYNKTTEEKSFAVGVFVDSSASAEAGANASATGMTANAKSNASAGAEAQSTATLGVRHSQSSEEIDSLTHNAATLNATGGSVTINAREDATFKGSQVNAAGNINIDAKNINNLAAVDRHSETRSSTTQTGGIYVSGGANAESNAGANASPLGGKASVSASAGAEGGAGLRYGREESSSNQGSTTSQVNTFTAGGDVNRTAENTIHDQGTQITAGGDINQSATTIKDEAVADTTWNISSDTSHEARLGIYGEGGVEASAGAQAGVGANASVKTETSAGAGIQASYDYSKKDSNEQTSQAVTSRYQAGGNINSTSSGETSLEGTQMQSGGDINLSADSLNYKAAANTFSKDKSSQEANAGVKVNVMEKSVDLAAGYGQGDTSESGSDAVAGGLSAGGGININTTNDTTLEGTQLNAGAGIDIASSEGDVNLLAAESTRQASSDGFKVGAEISLSKKSPGGSASGGYNEGEASATRRDGVSLTSGGGDINISSGGDTTAEGARINAGLGDVTIQAGGEVALKEAVNEESSSKAGFDLGIKASKKQQSFDAGVSVGESDSRQGQATHISGDNVTISGGKVIDQETRIESDRTTIDGPVEKRALTNEESGYDLAFDISGVNTKDQDLLGRKKKPTNTNNGNNNPAGGNKPGANNPGGNMPGGNKPSGNNPSKSPTSGGKTPTGNNNTPTTPSPPKKKKSEVQVPVNLPGDPGGGAPKVEMPDGQPVPEGITFDAATNTVTGSLPDDYQGPDSVILKVPQSDGSIQTMEVKLTP